MNQERIQRGVGDQTPPPDAVEALDRCRADLQQALHDAALARQQLEVARGARDRLLAALSHELRTPLTPIVLAMQILARRQDLPQVEREAIELIRRNLKIESQLIDDLLDLTRIARNAFVIDTEPVDLHAAITDAIRTCEADIQMKNQTLSIVLAAAWCHARGDFDRLRRVVVVLLGNASKFTSAGGAIRVRSYAEGDRFSLSVSDNGIGIEAGRLPAVFDAFGQTDESAVQGFGGLGLGLAISRATVQAHGGIITADSAGRDRGATFTVELPLIDPKPEQLTNQR